MMLNKIHNVFFVGVGGIGMSALARYFIANDKSVAGYDRTCSEITSALKKEGVVVIYKDKKRAIPKKFRVEKNKKNTLVVYTPAVSDDNIILSYFKQKGYTIKKRS